MTPTPTYSTTVMQLLTLMDLFMVVTEEGGSGRVAWTSISTWGGGV